MRVRVMTNPAQLLLAGNPGKRKKSSKAGRAWAKKMAAAKAAKAGKSTPPVKEHPVAKRRKKKSKASRDKRIMRRRARRSKRRAARVAHSAAPKRRRRRSRKASFKRRSRKVRAARRIRRKARRSRKTRTVSIGKGQAVVVRKRRGSRGRVRIKRRSRRSVKVGVNAGALSLTGGLTHFLANAKATMHDGVKGFAFALAGAGVSVAGGAFTSQVTSNLIARVAPSLLSNPIVARVLGAINYYLPGWAASKYLPGLSGKSRRAMLTGAAAAAIVEVVKPGMVRQTLSSIPVVGGFLSGMEDQASDLGAYVGYALNGEGNDYAGVYDANPGTGSGQQPDGTAIGMGDYVSLGDYVNLGDYAAVGSDAVSNILR